MSGQQHRYESCKDRDCPRALCIAYKDGYDDGFADGVASMAAGQ